MNQRIEILYDREHTLGHAFFIDLNNGSAIEDLAYVFKNKIIPLLQEYFFEDWEKIRMVLGDDQKTKDEFQFILEKTIDQNLFSNSANIKNKAIYSLNNAALNYPESYVQIYTKYPDTSAETNAES
jgi:5-methylcytosine-specific restriction protein B